METGKRDQAEKKMIRVVQETYSRPAQSGTEFDPDFIKMITRSLTDHNNGAPKSVFIERKIHTDPFHHLNGKGLKQTRANKNRPKLSPKPIKTSTRANSAIIAQNTIKKMGAEEWRRGVE